EGERNRALVGELARMADERGVSPAQLALAWLLAQGKEVVPIPGTQHTDRLEENVHAVDVSLTRADLDRLDGALPRSTWAGDRVAYAEHGLTRGHGPSATPSDAPEASGLSGASLQPPPRSDECGAPPV